MQAQGPQLRAVLERADLLPVREHHGIQIRHSVMDFSSRDGFVVPFSAPCELGSVTAAPNGVSLCMSEGIIIMTAQTAGRHRVAVSAEKSED